MRYPFEEDSSGDKLVTVGIVLAAVIAVLLVAWWAA